MSDYYAANADLDDKTYCDQIAVVTGWEFDAATFGIPPRTMEQSDTTHWLALTTANDALKNAAMELTSEDRSRFAVILGNSLGGEYARSTYLRYRWPFVQRAVRRALRETHGIGPATSRVIKQIRRHYLAPFPRLNEDSLPGAMANTIAGRICSYFDLGGGGYTIDGACSSSLLAVAHACDLLHRGQIDFVLCGGVDVSLDPFELIGFAKTKALAREDIRPYDARAEGMLPGEGCGMFVLARASTARARKLRVRALIRGWGVSSDGRGAIAAPRREGQIRALQRAYERAGYPLETVQLLEGHGTGTVVGDEIELSAILDMLRSAPPGEARPILIGSIKGNIGHCKAAAGAAGLMKVMMALERKVLPPTSGCEHPHRLFSRFERLAPALDGQEWKKCAGPRRAGVSAFGFGGSNAHVTVEESDDASPDNRSELSLLGSSQSTEIILLSAETREDLQRRMRRVQKAAAHLSRAELVDVAAELAAADQAARLRVAFVVTTPLRLADWLARCVSALAGGSELAALNCPADGIFAGDTDPTRPPRLAALFPGQGAQRVGMGRHLPRRYPAIRALLATFDSALEDILPDGTSTWIDRDVRTITPSRRVVWEAELEQTYNAQPAIVAASLSMVAALGFHGLRPDFVLGHSLGEISALCAAGVFTFEQGVRIAAARGRAMARLDVDDPGCMLQLAATPEETRALIDAHVEGLEIACYNAPHETVVSGPSSAVERLCRRCSDRAVEYSRLSVSAAFHSVRMARAAQELGIALQRERRGSHDRQIVSSVTGRWLKSSDSVDRLLTDQLTGPVRFTEAVGCLAEAEPDLWLEVGPGHALTGLVSRTLGERVCCLSTDSGQDEGFTQLNRVLAQAFVLGFPVASHSLFAHRYHRPQRVECPPRVIANPCERTVRAPTLSVPDEVPAVGAEDGKINVLNFALDWIVKRTGYARESIRPWMRLRDDLNLDSIKAMELVQVFTERYGRVIRSWSQWENVPLEELVGAFLSGEARPADSLGQGPLEPLRGLEHGDWVKRFDIRQIEVPLGMEAILPSMNPRSVLVSGGRTGRLMNTVLDGLTDAGYAPTWVSEQALIRGVIPRVPVGALIVIQSIPDEPFWEPVGQRRAPDVSELARRLLKMAQWCAASPESGSSAVRWLVVRASDGSPRARAADAGAGLLKSLRLEEPAVVTKWLRLPRTWSPVRWSETIVAELTRGGRWAEYGYDYAGRRYADLAVLSRQRPGPPPLASDDVVVATGGARGVTLELARVLGKELNARLVLVGRSAEGEPSVRQAIDRLHEAGVEARYYSCDVTDSAAVQQLIRVLRLEMGPIRGILHGAGVTHPAPLAHIAEREWVACVRTKTEGLANLVRYSEASELRMVHTLSSVIGHTGMSRQLDYAFANAWLAGAVEDLAERRPGIHAAALGYSVWKDTGIGRDLGSVDSLAALGVTTISTAAGVAAYREELRGRSATARRLIAGRLVPGLEAVFSPPLPPVRSRFLERMLRWIPGVEVIAEATLTDDHDLYLADHVFEGTVMFPAVMGIEALVSAAMTCLDRDDLPTVRDLDLRRPVIVPAGATVVVRIYALAGSSTESVTQVHVALRSEMDTFSEDCMVATCEFGSTSAEPPRYPLTETSRPPPSPEAASQLFRSLFQGPIFRWLTTIIDVERERRCLAEVRLPGRLRYFGRSSGWVTCTPYPGARDAFLQSILLMLEGRGLPTAIRELRIIARGAPGTTVLVRAQLVRALGERREIDIDVCSLDGRILEILHGVRVEPTDNGRRDRPLQLRDLRDELVALFPSDSCGVGIVRHASVSARPGDGHRGHAARANKVAVREALLDLHRQLGYSFVNELEVVHDDLGRPHLQSTEPSSSDRQHIAVSITDTVQLSIALVAPHPIGVDLELVESRTAQEWRGVLGGYGYSLALRLASQGFAELSLAGTCAWTVIEAAKKAPLEPPALETLSVRREGAWLALAAEGSGDDRMLTVPVTLDEDEHAVLTVVMRLKPARQSAPLPRGRLP